MSPNLIGTLPASTKPTRVQIWVVRPAGSRIFRNETLSGAATARERIMHGSDWMMGAIQANADAYYEDFRAYSRASKRNPRVSRSSSSWRTPFLPRSRPRRPYAPAHRRTFRSRRQDGPLSGRPGVEALRRLRREPPAPCPPELVNIATMTGPREW